MLLNLDGSWDAEMLELFGVPRTMLPRVVGSSDVAGSTEPPLLGAEIPIAGIAGDQQAALFGQACFRPGLSKNTYGTGCFFLMHTGHRPVASRNRLLTTLAAATGKKLEYALEGSVFVAGAAVQWLRDSLGIIKTAAETEALAASVPDTAGVYFVPAFVGLGAPHWNASARGAISGLTRSATAAHLTRATLEAIAYQTRELVEAMEADAGSPLTELRVDGGAAANDFLMQFQADMLGRPVVRPANVETTALGAAFLAGLAAGVWSGTEEIESFWKVDRRFEPRMEASRREELFAGWKRAVARVVS
jgi:glycerol kinase